MPLCHAPSTASRATGRERQVAAQRHDARLGHDVLAFLVALDRIGVFAGAFQQDVGKIRRGSVGSCAEPGGPAADDDKVETHGLPNTAAPEIDVEPVMSCRL